MAGLGILSAGVVVAGAAHMLTARNTANAAVNPNCTLIVPANPLTAQGLATPYQLTATNPADGPCNEANAGQTAFVQGAVINPATGQIMVYNPLVIDAGTQPAAAPVVPALPAGGVVALWFGFNGTTLTLAGADQVGGAAAASSATATATAAAAGAASASMTAPAAAVTSAAVTASPATAMTPARATTRKHHRHGARQAQAAATAAPAATTATAAPVAAGSPTLSGSPAAPSSAAAGTATAPAVTGTAPPAAANVPAASGAPDAILQQSNCIAGESIAGAFSSFTQVAACNAVAFFQAANTAVQAGTLQVPSPGTAKDGQPCLTTRNFALIDQDQSDNVTTKYLANGNGQTAQFTAANQQALAGATTLVNGSDNGLLDFFMAPALGCTPWQAPDLANGGTPVTALPLDELQAAQFAGQSGGPAALVPVSDPMVLDNNGNTSTDKTNTYRSIVDMSPLPAGETPAEYCGDMESIQGVRLQQDVNLLTGQPSPAADMANSLFTFLAMRLQQSFVNLNCANFGLKNDVSTTVDGNGVVVAACFLQQVNAVTAGAGNPTAGMTVCPATTAGSGSPAAPAASGGSAAAPAASGGSAAAPAAPPASATAPAAPGGNAAVADDQHRHWWY
jgi:hypothetical protein